MHAVSVTRIVRLAVATAVVAAAGAVAVSPAAAYPSTCRETFPDFPVNSFAVPPNSTAVGTVAVGVTGQIADIDVTISASAIQSATFWIGPDDDFEAHKVLLDSVGGTVDLAAATYDDEAAGERSGLSPFSGRYRPFEPLSALDGQQTARTWRLQVVSVGNATFFVDGWSITVTYAGCVPDGDSDGVPDTRDACQAGAAATASGCPLTTRSLTAKYRRGKFRGALSSPVASCQAGRSVTIWKVRSGPDRNRGTAATASDGRYKLTRAKRAGRYYAVFPRVVVSGVAECPAVQSATFRIR